MKAALKVTESTQKHVQDIRSGTFHSDISHRNNIEILILVEPISVANIATQLSDEDDLSSGLVYSSKKVSNTTCVKDYLGMLSSADNPTPAGKAATFVSFGSSKVQVEFEIIARRLRKRVLEAVTRERHGSEGVRIVRLLLDTGKMDEKQVRLIYLSFALSCADCNPRSPKSS